MTEEENLMDLISRLLNAELAPRELVVTCNIQRVTWSAWEAKPGQLKNVLIRGKQ